MNFNRLSISVVMLFLIGCAQPNDDVAPTETTEQALTTPAEDTAEPPISQSKKSAEWDLLDDTVLKVQLDPPDSTEVTLQVSRRYAIEVHGPLVELHYRIVTTEELEPAWILLSEPAKKDIGDGMFDTRYEAKLTLPQGNANIQFKVNQGFGDPYELSDWQVETP